MSKCSDVVSLPHLNYLGHCTYLLTLSNLINLPSLSLVSQKSPVAIIRSSVFISMNALTYPALLCSLTSSSRGNAQPSSRWPQGSAALSAAYTQHREPSTAFVYRVPAEETQHLPTQHGSLFENIWFCLRVFSIRSLCICINSFCQKGPTKGAHGVCSFLSCKSLIAGHYMLQAKRELHLTLQPM